MKTCRIQSVFLFLLLLLCSQNLLAAWYQVEVVVFDNLYADTDGESWYLNPGLPDRSDSIELIESLEDEEAEAKTEDSEEDEPGQREQDIPYKKLAEDFYRLGGVQRVLKLSREYRPLLHVAWQQPALNPRVARPVHIQQFEEPDPVIESDNDEEAFDIEALQSTADEFEDEYQILDLIFDGTIKLRSSRFLHVDVDIAYFPESFKGDEEEMTRDLAYQQADYVRLQETRKIKLNEIHYFDHPLFGLILRVSRLNLN